MDKEDKVFKDSARSYLNHYRKGRDEKGEDVGFRALYGDKAGSVARKDGAKCKVQKVEGWGGGNEGNDLDIPKVELWS